MRQARRDVGPFRRPCKRVDPGAALVGSALAFFGTQSTQVTNSYSLFSVRHYWGFYLFWAGLAAMTALLYRVQKQRLSKADQEAFQATADAIEQ